MQGILTGGLGWHVKMVLKKEKIEGAVAQTIMTRAKQGKSRFSIIGKRGSLLAVIQSGIEFKKKARERKEFRIPIKRPWLL